MPLSKVGRFMKLLKSIGCGVSKDDVSEPCAVGDIVHQQSRNAALAQALNAIPVGNSHDFDFSECICNKIPGRDSLSSSSADSELPGREEDIKATVADSGLKASRTEDVDDAHGATALAVLTGGTTTPTNVDEDDVGGSSRVVAMLASDVCDLEDHQGCSTSAIGIFTGTAILDALMSSGQASVAKHTFGGDFPAMVWQPPSLMVGTSLHEFNNLGSWWYIL